MSCQLCKSGVPRSAFFTYPIYGHIVSWSIGSSAWVPCSEEDRQKMKDVEFRLEEHDAKERSNA